MKALFKNLRHGEQERIMYCDTCGAEASANSNDYSAMSDPDYAFECCGETMEIVVKQTTFTAVGG